MKCAAFEIQLIFINFTSILKKNTAFLFPWSEIMLMKRLTLPELVKIRKIENGLSALGQIGRPFFIGQKVAVKIRLDIVIIITKRFSLLVQPLSECVKLK